MNAFVIRISFHRGASSYYTQTHGRFCWHFIQTLPRRNIGIHEQHRLLARGVLVLWEGDQMFLHQHIGQILFVDDHLGSFPNIFNFICGKYGKFWLLNLQTNLWRRQWFFYTYCVLGTDYYIHLPVSTDGRLLAWSISRNICVWMMI